MDAKVRKVIGVTGITLAVYIILKYMLVYIAPFLVAFLIVRLLNPLAERLKKYLPLGKGVILFCIMSLILALAGLALWFLGARLFAQIRSILAHLEWYEAKLEYAVDGCCRFINKNFGIESAQIRSVIDQNIDRFTGKIQEINITQVFQNSFRYAMIALKWFGAFFVVFVAALLIVRDYDEICRKLEKYSTWNRAVCVGERLWKMAGLWLRAQFIIMLVVMAECVVGLWILKNPYALLVGVLIGFLDVLPFIGTGTILLPWAVIWIFKGNFFYAAAYATLFLITSSTRDFMEPRLLGERLGIYPIVIAVVVYAGVCIYGAAGVLFGPLTLLIIKEISNEWIKG